jgi:hypothetical protein
VLLLLAAAGLALAIIARLQLVLHRRRRFDRAALRGPPGVPVQEEGPDDDELADVVRAQLAVLGQGSPRNAIVAAWVALEDTAEVAGVPRWPADTSTDFALRTLSTHPVDPGALNELAALYREARFSRHELAETHRERARTCLERLRLQLGGAPR